MHSLVRKSSPMLAERECILLLASRESLAERCTLCLRKRKDIVAKDIMLDTNIFLLYNARLWKRLLHYKNI